MARSEEHESQADIRSVARVGQICALFGSEVTELSAADVADLTGLNRTTAYRYCASMVAAGLLDRGARRGTFTLGALLLELGVHALGRRRVVDLAGPHLQALSARTSLTAVLALRGSTGPVVATVHEDASRGVVVTVHPGTRLDASAAQTHVFLAHGDAAMEQQVSAKLDAEARARLRTAVTSVRRTGHAVARHGDTTFAVAAPVFDAHGLAATMAVLGAGEIPDESTIVTAVLEAAGALGAELGDPHALAR